MRPPAIRLAVAVKLSKISWAAVHTAYLQGLERVGFMDNTPESHGVGSKHGWAEIYPPTPNTDQFCLASIALALQALNAAAQCEPLFKTPDRGYARTNETYTPAAVQRVPLSDLHHRVQDFMPTLT